jgi:hypothetical protein
MPKASEVRKVGVLMTRAEAIAVRARMVRGEPVSPIAAYKAIWTLSKRRDKMHIPRLNRETKDRCNSILLFNLGKVCSGVLV